MSVAVLVRCAGTPTETTSAGAAPRLSVLLPTIRPWPELADPLAASLRQIFDESYEILVLDGHGAGLDREPDPPVRWIRQPGADVFDLRALGLSAARGEIVLFSEDHCIAAPDWYARTSAAHRAHAAPVLIGPVRNHPDSSRRAADRASFALTLGAFAPPLATVPGWRLPVPTNVSVKRAAVAGKRLTPGWFEYDMLADAMARQAIGIAEDAVVAHLQSWGAIAAMDIHFQSGRSYGASTRHWPRDRRNAWWRKLAAAPRSLYRLSVPVIDRHGAGAPSSRADRWWLRSLVLANVAGQIAGALAGPGGSRRRLV
jgi:hypothetical protein